MADQYLSPTPYANPLTGYSNDLIQGLLGYMKDKQRTQQMQGLAGLLESTGIPQSVERAAYAQSPKALLDALTNVNRANVPLLKAETADALMTLAPVGGASARLAERGAKASAMLKAQGVTGNRYLDQGSRVVGGSNSSNFVVFPGNEDLLTIKEINDKAVGGLLGQSKAASAFDVSRRDASDIFGAGAERVMYKDPKSGGTMEVLAKPDGTASVLSLEVPETSRGKGIGQSLQAQVMQDFPEMMGQVSSKAAAKTAYRLGRRPPYMPDATLDDVYKMLEEDSSVNLVSPQMQKRFMPETTQEFAYPQEEAMMLAQQRAALPVEQGGLGLPAGNTAEQRAAAMGFDYNTIRFHGSDQDIYAFDPAKFGKNDQGWYGRGVTTDTDPEIASGYANYNEADNGQTVYPLVSRGKYMEWPEGQQPFSTARDSIAGTKDIQNLGYQGTRLTNDRDLYGDMPQFGTEQVTFNPEDIRSRFAAFDPFRRTAAIAASMGVAAPNLLAEESEKPKKKKNLLD